MSRLNKAMIIGRLGDEPEIRSTHNNTVVANMSIATSEKYKDRQTGEMIENTEWHRVVAWSRLAEICRDYLVKGSLVYFEGPLQTRKWTDKDGIERYSTEIKALNMIMLDSRGQSDSGHNTPKPINQGQPEDDLPF